MFWLGIAVSCVVSYVIQDNENKKLEREVEERRVKNPNN